MSKPDSGLVVPAEERSRKSGRDSAIYGQIVKKLEAYYVNRTVYEKYQHTKPLRGFFSTTTSKTTYRIEDAKSSVQYKMRPRLEEFSKKMCEIYSDVGDDSDEELLRVFLNWVKIFVSNVLNYPGFAEISGDDFSAEAVFSDLAKVDQDLVNRVCDEYQGLIKRVLYPSGYTGASADDNVEIEEFHGDKEFNYRVSQFIAKTGEKDESVLTHLYHRYTNTKFMSDLSDMIGLSKFVGASRRIYEKINGVRIQEEKMREDSFEALMGVISCCESRCAADPSFGELHQRCNRINGGILASFVNNVLENLEFLAPPDKPAKTFVSELGNMFAKNLVKSAKGKIIKSYDAGSERETIGANITTDERGQYVLLLTTPTSLSERIVSKFVQSGHSVSLRRLDQILNARYVYAGTQDMYTKTFENIAYERVKAELVGIGITPSAFLDIKNRQLLFSIDGIDRTLIAQLMKLIRTTNLKYAGDYEIDAVRAANKDTPTFKRFNITLRSAKNKVYRQWVADKNSPGNVNKILNDILRYLETVVLDSEKNKLAELKSRVKDMVSADATMDAEQIDSVVAQLLKKHFGPGYDVDDEDVIENLGNMNDSEITSITKTSLWFHYKLREPIPHNLREFVQSLQNPAVEDFGELEQDIAEATRLAEERKKAKKEAADAAKSNDSPKNNEVSQDAEEDDAEPITTTVIKKPKRKSSRRADANDDDQFVEV
jgi:hypothetical protein